MREDELERRMKKLEDAVHNLYRLIEIPSPSEYPDAPVVSGAALSSPSQSPQVAVSARVLDEIRGGKLIQAIKIHREETGIGLAQAKRAVDQAKRDAGL